MKKALVIIIALLVSVVFVSAGIAQEKSTPIVPPPAGAPEKVAAPEKTTPEKKAKKTKKTKTKKTKKKAPKTTPGASAQ